MLFNERDQVAARAAAAELPAVYGFRDHVDAGGLLSYGSAWHTIFIVRRPMLLTVKGAKPADLPVEFATKV